ncbi:MAG TPA: hypothetical protein VMV69_19890 [Pirellulales bacterium]|nr:hypothetical protein [Pirellulales bacterium]
MKRPLVLFSAALLAAGCHSAQRPNDPFLPRTTVPPPATGSYPAQGAAPYYPSPPGAYPGPTSSQGFVPNNSAPASPYTPPGGFAPGPSPGNGAAVPTGGRASQRPSSSGWAARAADPARSPRTAAAPDAEAIEPANPVQPAGYSAPASGQRNRVTRAQYAPRVRIRMPNTSTLASSTNDGLRRLISDDKPIDIMDLPPAHAR